MTRAAVLEFDEQQQIAAADADLILHEAASLVPDSLIEAVKRNAPPQPPGTRLLQIIRPGIGGGRGRRYYSPPMLEAHAHVFTGARMFKNHETDAQRKERGYLPRPVEQLGGRIVESWWDGTVPATDRFEQGAVFGWTRIVPAVEELIDTDPDMVEASINALATGTAPGRRQGQSVSIVEGIRSKPIAVDWIAGEGGAGGRVLTEAAEEADVLESMTDDEIEAYLAAERPGLLEALHEGDGNGTGGDVPNEITPEALREALASDDTRPVLVEAFRELLPELGINGGLDQAEVTRLVEAEVAERIDLARIDARAEADRQVELRDMRDKAESLIEASRLPAPVRDKLSRQFALDAPGLTGIGPDVDDEFNVTKPAIAKLEESVSAEIASFREVLGTVAPTRVSGQGGGGDGGGGSGGAPDAALVEAAKADWGPKRDPDGKPRPTSGSDMTDELLLGAGIAADAIPTLWSGR